MHDNLCCLDCNKSTYSIQCNGSERIKNIPDYGKISLKQNIFLARLEARNVFNAVLIFAYGIKSLFESFCKDYNYLCPPYFNHYSGELLLNTMINISFKYDQNKEFRLFNRSGTPFYNIFQFDNVGLLINIEN